MPTTSFDYRVRLKISPSSKEISSTDRDVLTKTTQPLKAKPVVPPLSMSVPEDLLEKKKVEAQAIADGYKEAERGVDKILGIIEGRTQSPDFTLVFDETKDADLLHSLRSLFSDNPNSMNYRMYRKLLEYSMQLGKEISEENAFA